MKAERIVRAACQALLCCVSGMAAADLTLVDTANNDLSFYGFVKLDATYQSDGTNSLVAPRFATGGDESAVNLTAMNSRFGFKWNGPTLNNGYRTAGVLEFDLFDPDSNNQMHVRNRLAAFTLSRAEQQWLFGQHWDVFSPLNPTTLMTNGNLWATGNLGFRRAQVRWSGENGERGLQWAASVNDPSTIDTDPSSDLPVVEGRLGVDVKQANLGISGALGEEEIGDDSESIAGISFDWTVPIPGDLTIKGEAALGENLGIFLSRSGPDQDVFALWVQLVETADASNDWWGGLGVESVDDVDTGAEDTRILFGGYQWKLAAAGDSKPVRLGVEGALFDTDLAEGGSENAAQVMFSAQYLF